MERFHVPQTEFIHTMYHNDLLTLITLIRLSEKYATLFLQLLKNSSLVSNPELSMMTVTYKTLISNGKRYISKLKQLFVKKIVHIHLKPRH